MEIKNNNGVFSIEGLTEEELNDIVAPCDFAAYDAPRKLIQAWEDLYDDDERTEEFFFNRYANIPVETEVAENGSVVVISEIRKLK